MAMVEEMVAMKCPEYDEVFEDQVGMPVSEYISEIRLHRAEKLLQNKGMIQKNFERQFG